MSTSHSGYVTAFGEAGVPTLGFERGVGYNPRVTFDGKVRNLGPERECCLLVLDSVTSSPQWIRQPKPRDVVHDVCVFVCE